MLTAQRRARDGSHHGGPRARDRHRRRDRAPRRLDHPRDRVLADGPADRAPAARRGRPAAQRGLGRQPAGPRGARDRRLPEPLRAPRAQPQPRALLDRLHARGADRLRPAGAPRAARARRPRARRAPRGPGRLQCADPGAAARSVWNSGGGGSWFLDTHGRNSTMSPNFTFMYRRRVSRFDPDAYDFEPRLDAAA